MEESIQSPSDPEEEKFYSVQEDIVQLEQILTERQSEVQNVSEKCATLHDQMLDSMMNSSSDFELDELTHKELQHRMQQEIDRQKKAVTYYQDTMKKQASKIDNLQNGLEVYREKCARLEAVLTDYTQPPSLLQDTPNALLQNESIVDEETLLMQLHHEKNRCQELSQINSLLRDQLVTATEVNRALTADIEHLNVEWQNTRKEWETKEIEFRQEGQSFTVYLTKEHHRLLSLWRNALHFRQEFIKLKTATEKDLTHMKSLLRNAFEVLGRICNQLQSSATQTSGSARSELENQVQKLNQEILGLQLKFETERTELNDKIKELTTTVENKQLLNDEKDKMYESLKGTIELMSAENTKGSFNKLHRCCIALKDIARIVVDIAEQKPCITSRSYDFSVVKKSLLSTTAHSLQTLCSNREFTDGTVAAIKSSLHERSLEVDKLSLQLAASKDRIKTQEKMIESLEAHKKSLSSLNISLSSQLSVSQATIENYVKDAHKIRNSLDETDNRKLWLEEMRNTLNSQIESLNAENDRLNQTQSKFHSKIEALQQERDKLKLSEQTALQDYNRCKRKTVVLETQLEEIEKQRETLQQKLQELMLDKEMVEQERDKIKLNLDTIEQQKIESDEEILLLRSENSTLQNKLLSLESQQESLTHEKDDLSKAYADITSEIEALKTKHLNEKSEMEAEKKKLRDKVQSLEEKCIALDIEIEKMKNELQLIETNKLSIEQEKANFLSENNNLKNQLTKIKIEKSHSDEELKILKQELNDRSSIFSKLAEEKEKLVRGSAILTIKAESSENELDQVKQLAEALKGEKEQLEQTLYASQQLLDALQHEKEDLKNDLDEEKSRLHFLESQLDELKKQNALDLESFAREKESLNKKILQTEEEFRHILQQERQRHEEDMNLFTQEKESQQQHFMTVQSELTEQLELQREMLNAKHEQEVADLKKQMILHEKELRERLFSSMKETEKAQNEDEYNKRLAELEDSLIDVEGKLCASEIKYAGAKQEMITSIETYKRLITNLEEEKSKLEKEALLLKSEQDKAIKIYESNISTLTEEKEEAIKEIYRLQNLLEEHKGEKDNLERKLENYILGVDDVKGQNQTIEQQNSVLRQKLNNSNSEMSIIKKSYDDLKERLKKYQTENIEIRDQLEGAKKKIDELEKIRLSGKEERQQLRLLLQETHKSRTDIKREYQLLHRHFNSLEMSLDSKTRELEEMRIFLAREEEIEAELKNEILLLKQKVLENDASREAQIKELSMMRQRLSETELKLKFIKEEHNLIIRDTISDENSFAEQRFSLEKSLSEITEESQNLRVKLSVAEGKAIALENKIAKLESSKRDTENKLHNLNLTLRSSLGLGFQADSGFQGSQLFLTPISSRRESPIKFTDSYDSKTKIQSPDQSSISEVSPLNTTVALDTTDLDIDLVKSALQDFIRKLYKTEKDKDSLKLEISSLKQQLDEQKENYNSQVIKIQSLNRQVELEKEEKENLMKNCSFSKNELTQLQDSMDSLQREKRKLLDKKNQSNHSIQLLQHEKQNLQTKIDDLKKLNTQLQEERETAYQAQLEAENNLIKLENTVRKLETEKMELENKISDKQAEIISLEQNVEQLKQSCSTMEDNNQSLQSTIENLNGMITKYKSNETALLQKVNNVEESLSKIVLELSICTKNLSQLKGKHSNCALEKSTLQNTIENLREVISDLKLRNETLNNQIQTVTDELGEIKVRKAELEGQIQGYETMISHNETLDIGVQEKLNSLEKEKYYLEQQLSRLTAAVTKSEELRLAAEREKQKIEKEKDCISKTCEKLKSNHLLIQEMANRSAVETSTLGNTLSKMETENQILNQKIQSLKAQLAESEQRHLEKLKEIEQKKKLSNEIELDKLRINKIHMEHILEVRDKHNKHTIAGLEQQVKFLREQLHYHHMPSYLTQRSVSSSQLNITSNGSPKPNLSEQNSFLLKSDNSIMKDKLIKNSPPLSAPSKLRPSTAYKRITSTPKAKKRLEDSFKP